MNRNVFKLGRKCLVDERGKPTAVLIDINEYKKIFKLLKSAYDIKDNKVEKIKLTKEIHTETEYDWDKLDKFVSGQIKKGEYNKYKTDNDAIGHSRRRICK